MKVTMYELLGMIKDGKAPKKIKYLDKIFNYNKLRADYLLIENKENEANREYLTDWIGLSKDGLNDEVEIIEEKEMCHKCHKYPVEYNQTYCEFCLGISKLEEHKIPKKIEMVGCHMKVNILDKETLLPTENMQTEFLIKKINEIIDYLEEIE